MPTMRSDPALVMLTGLVVTSLATCAVRAHAQDAGPTRPPMRWTGTTIDLRPDSLYSLPKPPGEPCTFPAPGCCRGDGEPDGGHCLELPLPGYREGTTATAERPAESPVDPPPTVARVQRRPPVEASEGPTPSQRRAVWIVGVLGAAFVAWLMRRRHVERTTELPGAPVTVPPTDAPPKPPPADTSGLYPLRLPSRQREEADARAQHCDETRARIAALLGCKPGDIRTEPNPHGQGCRAWVGGPSVTWPQALAADDGLAVSWTLGEVPAALARLLVEVRRRRRAKS